jgi:hypothetical protein
MSKISCNSNSGFHIEFDNGLTISVQFGHGAYCDNRNSSVDDVTGDYDFCRNAEIAVFDSKGKFVPISEHDNVAGHVDINHVLDFIVVVRNLPSSVNCDNWREHVEPI